MLINDFISVQPKVIKMLMNSYYKDRLVHSYLFEGEKGTKKKEIALFFAKLLYCEDDNKPCGKCNNCLRIDHHNHPNVLLIEPEQNTIKKEQVIYLQQEYAKTTLELGPKVYIIKDIDKMSINAANSILKFIEEPLPDTYTILITDNLQQIISTIISRCQVINFQPLPKEEIIEFLLLKQIDASIAKIVSQLTNDLDKALEIASDEKIIDIINLVISVARAILQLGEDAVIICEKSQVNLYNDKKVLEYFLDILLILMSDINCVVNNNDNIVFDQELTFIKENIHNITSDKIISNIDAILKAKINIRYNANTVLLLDHLLIKIM